VLGEFCTANQAPINNTAQQIPANLGQEQAAISFGNLVPTYRGGDEMSDNDRMGTEEIALSRLGTIGQPSLAEQLEQRRIQEGIARTMRDVVGRDAKHNPNQTVAPERTTPGGAAPVVTAGERGWVEPKPLALPPGQEVIEALCNAALPHGKGLKK
jgi:hypothetical protein